MHEEHRNGDMRGCLDRLEARIKFLEGENRQLVSIVRDISPLWVGVIIVDAGDRRIIGGGRIRFAVSGERAVFFGLPVGFKRAAGRFDALLMVLKLSVASVIRLSSLLCKIPIYKVQGRKSHQLSRNKQYQ